MTAMIETILTERTLVPENEVRRYSFPVEYILRNTNIEESVYSVLGNKQDFDKLVEILAKSELKIQTPDADLAQHTIFSGLPEKKAGHDILILNSTDQKIISGSGYDPIVVGSKEEVLNHLGVTMQLNKEFPKKLVRHTGPSEMLVDIYNHETGFKKEDLEFVIYTSLAVPLKRVYTTPFS